MQSECVEYIFMNPINSEGCNKFGLDYISSWACLIEDSLIFTAWIKRKEHDAKYLHSESW